MFHLSKPECLIINNLIIREVSKMSCNCKPQHDPCKCETNKAEKIEVHVHINQHEQKCTCQKKKCPDVKVYY